MDICFPSNGKEGYFRVTNVGAEWIELTPLDDRGATEGKPFWVVSRGISLVPKPEVESGDGRYIQVDDNADGATIRRLADEALAAKCKNLVL